MNSKTWRTGAALLVAATAACADVPTTPGSALAPRAPRLTTTTSFADTTILRFDVAPSDAEKVVLGGTYKIDIPAGAICDLETSGYGPGTWDNPCAVEEGRVTFTVKSWTDASGYTRL